VCRKFIYIVSVFFHNKLKFIMKKHKQTRNSVRLYTSSTRLLFFTIVLMPVMAHEYFPPMFCGEENCYTGLLVLLNFKTKLNTIYI
jgi:hypothetical protein